MCVCVCVVERKPQWDVPVISEFDECGPTDDGDCISYSPTNLCTRYNVDHNYYVVCRNILSQYARWSSGGLAGLLHDIPADADTSKSIPHLVEQCARSAPGQSRFDVKDRLMTALLNLLKLHGSKH
jgi:hypothetical protein